VRAGSIIQERYELEARLGHGGMAEVWQALDTRLKRPVAIKVLAPQLTEDPEFLVRFFSEAQAIAKISHPNVVEVLDFGQHDGSPYLVMELVPGGALTDKMGEPVAPAEAFELVAAAARGAGAAHSEAIVHRDLKPANILLDEDGRPKLADFGIAASARSERLTATGAAIGSPHYISPEQASSGEATPASDVYSLGIVLYELVTGRRPFEGDNVTAVAIAQVEQEPPAPSTVAPDLDAAVDAIVLKCLAKDPGERFTDGNELAEILSRGPAAITVLEETATPIAAATGWTRRRSLAVAALALLLLGGVAVGVIARNHDVPPASADEGYEPMEDVGGLRIQRSPSASDDTADRDASPSPSPSDTPSGMRSRSPKPQKASGGDKEESEPSPEPTPTEEEEPSPEPTTEEASPQP